jgi:hypothetical protein
MDWIDGIQLDAYMARQPSDAARTAVAEKLVRAWYRMLFVERLNYVDFHPGNLLFPEDGRIALLDFGMMVKFSDELWEVMRIMDRALTTGRREDRFVALTRWNEIGDSPSEAHRLNVLDDYADWCWRSRYAGGEFDFGDEADFRRGIELFTRLVTHRYSRSKPCTPVMARSNFGWRSILYRLKVKLDIRRIAEEEVKATGWDRSEYA